MGGSRNLEDSASLGVTAVILVFVTVMTLAIIVKFQRNLKYPEAQQKLILIFLMPLCIGWAAWVELLKESPARSLEFLMNLFKAICIASFMLYIERILGWVREGNVNRYDEESKFKMLVSNTVRKGICFKVQPKTTLEQAHRYLKIIRILVFQQCIILTLLGIIGIIMIVSTGNYNFHNSTQNMVFEIFAGVKSVSSIVSLLSLLNLIIYVKDIPQMSHFQFLHKFIIIKLGLVFTEVQPIIIGQFAKNGLIASTSDYSAEEITTYTNALMVVSEMIILCFLLVEVFPVADYEVHPEIRAKMTEENDIKTNLLST